MAVESKLRLAARLVALDDDKRVLLFRYAPPVGEWFWATPGGGLEENESFEQAAAREAAEELGVKAVRLEPLWERVGEFLWGEHKVRQREKYFLLRLQLREFSGEVRELHRRENIVEARWWTVTEIESSAELIFPEDLAENLKKTVTMAGPW